MSVKKLEILINIKNNYFKLQLNKLKSFVTDEQWQDILSFDMALNSHFANVVTKYIDELITDFTDPEWVQIMIKSRAVVTAEGGALSHSAIISIELGIPCVVGIGYKKVDELKCVSKIKVDGTRGIIEIY